MKIINLISLRRELDVSLITARNIKQFKAQSLARHHRKEWRSREFRKLNCWEHSVIYLPHYPGDATSSLFSVFIRKTCLELDVRELLHITALFDTTSFGQKRNSSGVNYPPQSYRMDNHASMPCGLLLLSTENHYNNYCSSGGNSIKIIYWKVNWYLKQGNLDVIDHSASLNSCSYSWQHLSTFQDLFWLVLHRVDALTVASVQPSKSFA